jgi:hypothetical protein
MLTNATADYLERSTVLRTLLGDYLDRVTERAFDLPFLLLLPEMGFYDVHYSHGAMEFGKDFIAKRIEDGRVVQYSFQTKAGNIGQAAWQNDIQGQMLTSIVTDLVHGGFDLHAPHKPVLVTTGDLIGNAGHLLTALNRTIADTYHKPESQIALWAKQNLVDFLVEHGLAGMLRSNAEGQLEFGRFLIIHGQSLQDRLSARELELHSRHWLRSPVELNQLLQSAIEAELLTQQCTENGRWYEAAFALLGAIRVLSAAAFATSANLTDPYAQAVAQLHQLCASAVAAFQVEWEPGRNLLDLASLDIVTYSVQCARFMDLASLAYFTADDEAARSQVAAFLVDLLRHEPGCTHPISDNYAVTLVMAMLVLCNERQTELAGELLGNAVVWMCDRYQDGAGLAGIGAEEQDEVQRLLGPGLGMTGVTRISSSFLATALTDLAAFIADPHLYRNIVDDIEISDIHPEYFGARDSAGPFGAAGENIAHFSSVHYEDVLTDFKAFRFADHLAGEPATFRFIDVFGAVAAVMNMALARDRYFPRLWMQLAPNHRPSSESNVAGVADSGEVDG